MTIGLNRDYDYTKSDQHTLARATRKAKEAIAFEFASKGQKAKPKKPSKAKPKRKY